MGFLKISNHLKKKGETLWKLSEAYHWHWFSAWRCREKTGRYQGGRSGGIEGYGSAGTGRDQALIHARQKGELL
ncbi:MAG TPA: hypothetical protein VKA69_00305 [Desulfobacteria bacterium]|nr:hypothetical protein [Desulfobacteria bacterium]